MIDMPFISASDFKRLVLWTPAMILVAATPAFTLFPWLAADNGGYLRTNQLGDADRNMLLLWVIVSVVIGVAVLVTLAIRIRKKHPMPVADAVKKTTQLWMWTLAAPILPLLALHRIEENRPFLVLFLILVGSACVGYGAYHLANAVTSNFSRKFDVPKWAGFFAVIALTLFYAVMLSRYALIHHRNLGTSLFDLGIYTNTLWHTSQGNILGCSLIKGGNHAAAHFDPILIIFSPLFWFFPSPKTLLILQSVWLSLGAIPLYLLAIFRFKRVWLGLVLAGVYILYPALQGANLYDFHSLTLAAPVIIWLIYALEAKKNVVFYVALTVLLLVREDMALVSVFVGFYAWWIGRKQQGVITIVLALCYFLFVKLVIMSGAGLATGGEKSYEYTYYFKDMIPVSHEGALGIVRTLLTNPAFVLGHIFTEPKVLFLLKLLAPVLFLPLFAGSMRWLFLYGLAFTMLATREHLFDIGFQYSVVLFPFLLASLPYAMTTVIDSKLVVNSGLSRRAMVVALGVALVFSSVMMTRSFGAMGDNTVFHGGFSRLRVDLGDKHLEREKWLASLQDRIPPHASVSATERVGAHLSVRDTILRFTWLEPTDYYVIRGSKVKNGRKKKAYKRFRKNKNYVLVEKMHGIYVYKRKDAPAMLPSNGK